MSTCGGGDPGRGCGKPIVWGQDEAGKRVPLDPRAPVYRLVQYDPQARLYAIERVTEGVHVSHFATCPKTDQFTGGNGRTAPRQDGRAAASGERPR